MKTITGTLTFFLILLLLHACNDQSAEIDKKTAAESSLSMHIDTDKWLGKWNGPEGTYLQITGGQGKYEIIIQDLDSTHIYQAISIDKKIQFKRNGKTETIRASNGVDTGMKWLSDKSNCLTIRSGEGFCRD